MEEITYAKIRREDKTQLRTLIDHVLRSLEKPEYFIAYAEWELNRLFDESYALLHGAYHGSKLVGMSQLYCDEELISEHVNKLELIGKKTCELGGSLVLPEYRGKDIMYHLVKVQADIARKSDYDYVIALAHPDNVGSIKALEKLGLHYVKTDLVNQNYLRNLYVMELPGPVDASAEDNSFC